MDSAILNAIGLLSSHLVSVAILTPIVGAVVTFAIPRRLPNLGRIAAVAASFACAAICIVAFVRIRGTGEIELVELADWIPSLGVYYRIGLDGVSALMSCTAALICTSALVYSWQEIGKGQKLFNAFALVCEGSLIGLFAAADAFLFYVFWNLAIICMCFMAGMWGGPRKIGAAFKLAAFAAVGSAAMLVAFAYAGARAESFCVVDWMAVKFTVFEQAWLFGALAFAFGIFVPIVGLHSWLADVAEESPSCGAMIVGSVMLAAGAYGLFRIAMPLAPVAVAVSSKAMLVLSSVAVFFGAFLALSERDVRRTVASISISQMGLVMLGLFSLQGLAASGAVLLAASQAIACAALYSLAGMQRARAGECTVDGLAGTGKSMPAAALMLAVFSASIIGVPGLAGFAAQFTTLLGSFQTRTVYSAVSLGGLILLWIAIFRLVSGNVFGRREGQSEKRFPDMRAVEATVVFPLIAALLIVGIYPHLLLGKVERSAGAFVKLVKRVEMIIPAQGLDR